MPILVCRFYWHTQHSRFWVLSPWYDAGGAWACHALCRQRCVPRPVAKRSPVVPWQICTRLHVRFQGHISERKVAIFLQWSWMFEQNSKWPAHVTSLKVVVSSIFCVFRNGVQIALENMSTSDHSRSKSLSFKLRLSAAWQHSQWLEQPI